MKWDNVMTDVFSPDRIDFVGIYVIMFVTVLISLMKVSVCVRACMRARGWMDEWVCGWVSVWVHACVWLCIVGCARIWMYDCVRNMFRHKCIVGWIIINLPTCVLHSKVSNRLVSLIAGYSAISVLFLGLRQCVLHRDVQGQWVMNRVNWR